MLRLLLAGASYKQVATELAISYNTAKVHIGNVYAEFGVESHVELMSLALRTPWLRAFAPPEKVSGPSPD